MRTYIDALLARARAAALRKQEQQEEDDAIKQEIAEQTDDYIRRLAVWEKSDAP